MFEQLFYTFIVYMLVISGVFAIVFWFVENIIFPYFPGCHNQYKGYVGHHL